MLVMYVYYDIVNEAAVVKYIMIFISMVIINSLYREQF